MPPSVAALQESDVRLTLKKPLLNLTQIESAYLQQRHILLDSWGQRRRALAHVLGFD